MPDEPLISTHDLNEFVAACLLITDGALRWPTKERGDATLAEWAKRHVSARAFRDAMKRVRAMQPDDRGTHIRKAMGDYDA